MYLLSTFCGREALKDLILARLEVSCVGDSSMHHLIWFHPWVANIRFIMCLHHPLGLLIHTFCDIVADTLIRIFIFCQLIETNCFVEAFEYGRNFEHFAFSLLLF